jgi:hypothetical protein
LFSVFGFSWAQLKSEHAAWFSLYYEFELCDTNIFKVVQFKTSSAMILSTNK